MGLELPFASRFTQLSFTGHLNSLGLVLLIMRLESPSCWYSFCFVQLYSFMCSSCSTYFRCAQVFLWKLYDGRLKFFCANHGFWTTKLPTIDSSPTHTWHCVVQFVFFNFYACTTNGFHCFDPVAVMIFKILPCPHICHDSSYTLLGSRNT